MLINRVIKKERNHFIVLEFVVNSTQNHPRTSTVAETKANYVYVEVIISIYEVIKGTGLGIAC
jgi:hypothetical protein